MTFSCRLRSFRMAKPPPHLYQAVTPVYMIRVKAPPRKSLGGHEQPASKFSRFFMGVVGPCGHALTLTPVCRRDQSRAPFLGRGSGPRRPRYYEPLGLPPGTSPFRLRLIGAAFARRGPPGRVSPVPCWTVVACPSLYPGGVLHPVSGVGCSLLPSPWHERLGHPSLSGAYVTGLAGFTLSHWAHDLAPLHTRAYTLARALDAPLRRGNLFPRPGPATRRSGAYRDGTSTR